MVSIHFHRHQMIGAQNQLVGGKRGLTTFILKMREMKFNTVVGCPR